MRRPSSPPRARTERPVSPFSTLPPWRTSTSWRSTSSPIERGSQPVWPERSTGRYVDFVQATEPGDQSFDYPMIYEAKLIGNDFDTAASYEKLIRTAGDRTAPTYLIITNQMKIYDWYFGILPLHALDHLETRLREDDRWSVYKSTSEYVIFKSTPALTGAK